MGLRIHFTYEDLARVVLAEEPDPLREGLLSVSDWLSDPQRCSGM